jgi:hypothetical protein
VNNNLYNPFAGWIILFGVAMAVGQTMLMGNPPPVTRDQLGKLGK